MITQEEAKASELCAGCNRHKDIGLIVCWKCFKYRTDITPFKYFEGTFEEWQKMLADNNQANRNKGG